MTPGGLCIMAPPYDDEERLALLFESMIEYGLHHGAQLVVYKDGERVVNLAGGTTGPDGDEVTGDTRFVFFSSTKPLTGACIHQLVEAGELEYDEPVATYWPEFAERGEGPKDEITVRHVLSHQGGFPYGPFDAQPDKWTDWDAVVDAMERIDLQFDPGTHAAYHPLNYGWVLGELVRRASGTPIGAYSRENVMEPLGLDRTYIGLPDEEPDDVATLVPFEEFDRWRRPEWGLEADYSDAARNFNQEAIHRAPIPAAGGVGTAGDLARFYACLANGGALDGARILDRDTVDEATSEQIAVEQDGTLSTPTRYGLGFFLAGTPGDSYATLPPEHVFGHGGMGTSTSWADPEAHLSFSFICNGLRDGYEHGARASRLGDAVRRIYA